MRCARPKRADLDDFYGRLDDAARLHPLAMIRPEDLVAHVADRYGFRAQNLVRFDQDVVLLRRNRGTNWVARLFGVERRPAAVEGDAAVLRWLESQNYPAERAATADPVSRIGDHTVLVTEAVTAVPRVERRAAIKDAGGIRALGSLLGGLHTLPLSSGAPERSGGAWHHIADGAPADELAVAGSWLEDAQAEASVRDLAHLGTLADALEKADGCDGLPEAFVHPDFVLANVVATRGMGMVLVDWTGAGRGPRLWSLAFLLWAEGNKDLRRVDLAVAGYRRHVKLEQEEIERLERAIVARPLVFAIWRLRHGSLAPADAAGGVEDSLRLARAIASRARAVLTA